MEAALAQDVWSRPRHSSSGLIASNVTTMSPCLISVHPMALLRLELLHTFRQAGYGQDQHPMLPTSIFGSIVFD